MALKVIKKYMVASESVALDCLGYKVERDIKPGESIFIDMEKKIFIFMIIVKSAVIVPVFLNMFI